MGCLTLSVKIKATSIPEKRITKNMTAPKAVMGFQELQAGERVHYARASLRILMINEDLSPGDQSKHTKYLWLDLKWNRKVLECHQLLFDA